MSNGRTLAEAEKQIAELVKENKRLAVELEGAQGQSAVLQTAISKAIAERTTAEKQAATLKTQLESAQETLAKLMPENDALTAQVGRLTRQVEKNPLNPLSVEEASVLFDRVLTAFRSSKTLEIREASLSLKLATGKIGDVPVILLPDPKSADPATLHELKIDLTPFTSPSRILPSPTDLPGKVTDTAREGPAPKKGGVRKRSS
jgi:regulator of replication initiation timing